jgi:predicted Ser/Thr protein kinase
MAAPNSSELLALQTAVAGEYVIERELGRGGMGIVYLARDVELERPVAIKVLPPEYAVRPELRERFLREARTAGKLSHPNIVPVHRADDIGGFVFFVMAYVDGETLGQRVRGRGPLSPAEAARALREVAWALAYAHARGVVHRDVKPDNILLERETGRALVTDFGIALRSGTGDLTEEGTVMGTAQFMSPEQAAGEPLDGRSDLYSLGVVGFFALTGNLPFDGPTVQSILSKHLTQPHEPLHGRPDIPVALGKAVDRCLGKTPDDRWLTGEALADAIGDATPTVHTIPAPIRVWLTKGGWMGPLIGIWYFILALDVLDGDSATTSTILAAIIPVAVYGLINGALARRALDAGYGYEDLIAGLRRWLEERREERRFDVGREPPIAFKIARWITYGAWAVIAAVLIVFPFNPVDVPVATLLEQYTAHFGWIVFTAFAGSAFGMMYPGRRVSDRDWLGSLRWKFWHGPLGRALVRVAGIGGNARTVATSSHRPTEIAIGLAAEDLFDALPRSTQQRFKDLPGVVRRLEDEAQAIRGRMEKLSSTAAGVTTRAQPSPEQTQLVADLTAVREREQRRLSAAIAALEAIRLDLLRLSAGAGNPDSLTNAIAVAARLGVEIDEATKIAT